MDHAIEDVALMLKVPRWDMHIVSLVFNSLGLLIDIELLTIVMTIQNE